MHKLRVKHVIVWAAAMLTLISPLSVRGNVSAQERGTGQFWVTVYEDRNGDGTRSAGEPLVTRGVNVELRDSAGVVIASTLLEQGSSPTPGMVGFQYLLPGQYTLVVSSPELTPTTPTEFTAVIEEGAMPTVVEFGGQRGVTTEAADTNPLLAVDEERQRVARFAISGLGALLVIGFMSAVGIVLYGLMLRSRLVPAQRDAYIRATQTGSMRATGTTNRAVRTTGSMRPVQAPVIEPPAPNDEMFRPPQKTDTAEHRRSLGDNQDNGG